MKKSIIALTALATIGSAQAASNTFKFRVFSSGSDIFPCNAGIMHKTTNNSAGYTVDTDNASHNGQGSEIVDNSTVLTSTADYMSYKVVDLDEWTGDWTEKLSAKKSAGATGFASVFDESGVDDRYFDLETASKISTPIHKKDDVNEIISSLDFVLSSASYGTEYFVDICYYAPQFDTSEYDSYSISASAEFSNLTDKTYLENANITATVQTACDGVEQETVEAEISNAGRTSLLSDSSLSSHHDDDDEDDDNDSSNGLKKCVVRYTFKENASTRRPHALQGGVFTLHTDIAKK